MVNDLPRVNVSSIRDHRGRGSCGTPPTPPALASYQPVGAELHRGSGSDTPLLLMRPTDSAEPGICQRTALRPEAATAELESGGFY